MREEGTETVPVMSPIFTGVGGSVERLEMGYAPKSMERDTAKGELCGMRMVRDLGAWDVRVKLRVGGRGEEEKW